ncbi:MAG TPA: protein kinase, partial [Blastocatellia bacterium]|nr:protein kinase [Blastocatellia bacterium]
TTQPGVVLGTVPYMSPEQVLGREVDHCSDIFSLGVSLYEMITGRLPFAGATASETMDRILHAQPEAIARFNYDAPAELERIVRKCLEKDRAWRYQSARELLIDLRHLKRDSGSSTVQAEKTADATARRTEVQRRGTNYIARIAVIAALALGVSALVWLIISRITSKPSSQPPLRITPLTTYHGLELFPSFSPDGTQLAFAWNGEKQDNFDIYTRSVEHGTPLRLTTDPAQDISPVWSPDGRWIAFLRYLPDGKAGLFLTTPLSRAERLLTEVAAPSRRAGFWGPHLAWSPDSKWIATSDSSSPEEPSGLVLISIETGEKRPISLPATFAGGAISATFAGGVISPAFSPDGRWLAFIRMFGFFVSELYLLALTDDLEPRGEPIQLTYFKNQRTASPVWSRDGREIIFASGGAWDSRLYRIAVEEPGKPQQIESVDDIHQVLAISHATHRLAYVRTVWDTNIWRLQLGADEKIVGSPSGLISSTRQELNPQFSPDGKQVAFLSDRSGDSEVWVCESEGSNARQLTSFGGPQADCARWSPDGERLVFQTYPEGHLDIYLVNVRGGPPERLTHEPGDDNLPSWSGDGRWIYFTSNRSGATQVWKMRTDGSGAVQVTRNGGSAPRESTDGKVLYYTKPTPRGLAVWRVPVDGGEEVEVLTGISDWSNYLPTDKGIYFTPLTESSDGTSIQFLNFADGKIRTIATLAKRVFLGLTISPDGRSLLYTQWDQEGFDLMLVESFR